MERTVIIELDVRPILEQGVDPFDKIMETLKDLKDENTLLIINTFEPVPLLNLLRKKGYTYEVERPEAGTVHTYVKKDQGALKEQESDIENNTESPSFEDIETRFAGRLHTVDVRDLEMPMPMVTILQELEQLSAGYALYVHHKKLPQYLLPELKDRNYKYVVKEIDEENLKLIIFK